MIIMRGKLIGKENPDPTPEGKRREYRSVLAAENA
jgi:hypothetical protein